jgi:hypothetical protein
MTEADWLASNPIAVLSFLQDQGWQSERKCRLFAVTCCRRIWYIMSDARSRSAVEAAERYADGLTDLAQLGASRNLAYEAYDMVAYSNLPPAKALLSLAACAAFAVTLHDPRLAPGWVSAMVLNVVSSHQVSSPGPVEAEWAAHCDLLRDIFGNPFRPLSLDPSWLTSSVVALAEGIYAERAFDRLPILADALQDAGCDNPEVLDHCREPGPHVRGCFVVDLLTGRT